LGKRLLFSGYRSYELGIFKESDPKVAVIKKLLKSVFTGYLEEGYTWLLITGNLGSELWGAQVWTALKAEYPEARLALMFPYEGFGEKWNENNQEILQRIVFSADFTEPTSHKPYETPQQLKDHDRFMVEHSDSALLLYDREFEGKPEFLYQRIENYAADHPYEYRLLSMEDLQEAATPQN
jgi:uncharacterized phage-like protein YoqJ